MNASLMILAILFCFGAAAFFSGTESGMLSVSHARLMHLVRAGKFEAKLLSGYLQDLQRFLATILVGNNLASVMLSTLSASLAQFCFPGQRMLQTVWAVTVAFMMLFFCEYLPKLFFTTRPLRRTLLVVRPFFVVEKLLTPLTVLVLFLTEWLVPKDRKGMTHRFLMTREYIQNVVSDAKDGSQITAFERLMINRVLALQAQTAAQVMTPLPRVTRTVANSPLRDCFQLVRDSGHVRLPVFSEEGDRCLGVLNVLDVLTISSAPEQGRACEWMREPFFVYADERADDVLPLMRKNRQPMAIVRTRADGAALGVITEENVLFALTDSLRNVKV